MSNKTYAKLPLFNKAFPFIVCGLAGLFLIYEFILQVCPSVMTHQLMDQLGIDALTLGTMMAFYYYSYSSMQLVAGLSFDRFGARKTLTLATLVCAIGTLLMAVATTPSIVAIGRLLTGCGSACAFVGVLFLGKRWFAHKYFYLVAGITEMMGCLGAIIGVGPTAIIVHNYGWRTTLWGLAMVGFGLSAIIYLVIREKPIHTLEQIGASLKSNIEYKTPLLERLKIVLSNSQTWVIGLYALFVFAPIPAFAALWGVPFLMSVYHLSAPVAGSACALIWLGMGVGSLFAGWISEQMGSRNKPLVLSAAIGVFATVAILYMHLSFGFLMIFLFLFGVGTSGQSLSFNVVNDNVSQKVAGTAMGFNNLMIVISGALFQPLVGLILRNHWDGTMLAGAPVYSEHAYRVGLFMLPLCYFVAMFIGILFVRETYCKSLAQQANIKLKSKEKTKTPKNADIKTSAN